MALTQDNDVLLRQTLPAGYVIQHGRPHILLHILAFALGSVVLACAGICRGSVGGGHRDICQGELDSLSSSLGEVLSDWRALWSSASVACSERRLSISCESQLASSCDRS